VTERAADIAIRVEGMRQLGAVVNAMRGIAAARAQQAHGQIEAVDAYAATISAAISRALVRMPPSQPGTAKSKHPALILFCAEQGFAGTYTERVLDAAREKLAGCELFLIGTRGATIAAERGITPVWQSALPSHSPGVPKLADRIAEALYQRIAAGKIDSLEAIFSRRQPGGGTHVECQLLFPLDTTRFAPATGANPPLLNLAPEALLAELTADYLHAALCRAALHAFAAENQARMEAMASARRQIDRQLDTLRSQHRQARQEEITAEIIELAAGETASRSNQQS